MDAGGETAVCKVLNGVIAQCTGDWEGVCGRNSVSAESQIAWYAASGSVRHRGGHVIILPSQRVAAKSRKLSLHLT